MEISKKDEMVSKRATVDERFRGAHFRKAKQESTCAEYWTCKQKIYTIAMQISRDEPVEAQTAALPSTHSGSQYDRSW